MNAFETTEEFCLHFASVLVVVGGRKYICLHKDFSRLLVPHTPVKGPRDKVQSEAIFGWAIRRSPRRLVLVELILSWRCWPVVVFDALIK